MAALDVGVTAPSAADGEQDCTESYHGVKIRKYGRYFHELSASGIQYKPIIWSTWGRPHPSATAVLQSLAARASRRRGMTSGRDLLRSVCTSISLALQRRAARKAIACIRVEEDDDDGG